MNGNESSDFFSRMSIKLGTPMGQVQDLLHPPIGISEEDSPERISMISGRSKFIHYIRKVEEPVRPSITRSTTLLTNESEASQKFLEDSDAKSKAIRDAMIQWASLKFSLQLGIQDAIEFSSQVVPSDIKVPQALSSIEHKVQTALLQQLVRNIAVDVLDCDSDLEALSLLKESGSSSTNNDIMSRFMEMAKAASAKRGDVK